MLNTLYEKLGEQSNVAIIIISIALMLLCGFLMTRITKKLRLPKWFDVYYDDGFGCIINSAVRYSLGHYSYMPSTTVRFVLKYLMVLDVRTITVMIKDIDRELVDENLPYRDIWLSLKYALEDRLPKIQNESGDKNR